MFLCVIICGSEIKKQKDFDMSYCANCSNKDQKTGKCAYSGNCIIKKLNLDPKYVPDFIASATKKIVEDIKKEASVAEFNPFQRGNGCVLPVVPANKAYVHTR